MKIISKFAWRTDLENSFLIGFVRYCPIWSRKGTKTQPLSSPNQSQNQPPKPGEQGIGNLQRQSVQIGTLGYPIGKVAVGGTAYSYDTATKKTRSSYQPLATSYQPPATSYQLPEETGRASDRSQLRSKRSLRLPQKRQRLGVSEGDSYTGQHHQGVGLVSLQLYWWIPVYI